MHLQFFVLLLCASAQLCSSSREFPVHNCTACPILDRYNTTVATCEDSGVKKVCRCLTVPTGNIFSTVAHFPLTKGDVTQCVNAWATAPHLYAASWSAPAIVWLCITVHFFYIVVVSGMCSKHCRCTKSNTSALLGGISALSFFLCTLLGVVSQQYFFAMGKRTSGYNALGNALNVLHSSFTFFCLSSMTLVATSISDTVYHGEHMACRRRCINIVFWSVNIVATALFFCSVILSAMNVDQALHNMVYLPMLTIAMLILLGSAVLIVIAHCEIRKIVREHSASKTKPALVLKMADLSVAIYRYFYPFLICNFVWVLYNALLNPSVINLSPAGHWIGLSFRCFLQGICYVFIPCLLEGKPVPTFPTCLCRRGGQYSGLQFTPALGKALALLKKYGLDTQHRQDFPVEAAMESLLSTSPLMVKAAPDMDLMACIDYLVKRCVDDEGQLANGFVEMPVGRLLRPGCSQHVVVDGDVALLNRKAEKCLQWAQDPDRPAIADMSDDEAAAIQLYTQHCCLYPMLNAALRDHTHPERLTAFMPYLKLLLTALNKLPLVRQKVYRGMSVDLHETYNQLPGKVFCWWAFSSTTIRKSQAEVFMGSGDRTLFSIDVIGVDISQFSAFQNESEVLLLPGTCLVVEPGVMVERNYWSFEASVWDAAQQQLQLQHGEGKVGNGESERPGSGINDGQDDSGLSGPRFQNTDLPHPGWEEIVLTEDSRPPTPHTPATPHTNSRERPPNTRERPPNTRERPPNTGERPPTRERPKTSHTNSRERPPTRERPNSREQSPTARERPTPKEIFSPKDSRSPTPHTNSRERPPNTWERPPTTRERPPTCGNFLPEDSRPPMSHTNSK